MHRYAAEHDGVKVLHKVRRIDQMLPSFGQIDAIGSEVALIRTLLRSRGFESDIFAETSWNSNDTFPVSQYSEYSSRGNIVVHQFSIGSTIPFLLHKQNSYRVTRYHNITPPGYFSFPQSSHTYLKCVQGRSQLPLIKRISEAYWPVSDYNELDLCRDGAVVLPKMPVLREYQRLAKINACMNTQKNLKRSNRKSILFVGRIIPNKAQHDLILFLSLYHRFVDKDLQLLLVGGMEPHYTNVILTNLAKERGLSICMGPKTADDYTADVIFSGPIPDAEMVSYYRHADAFVSLSNHEGFGVPLVEAMYFSLPLLCHAAAAVPETVGDAAILIDKDNPSDVLSKLYSILHNETVRANCIAAATAKRQQYSWENLEHLFDDGLDMLLQQHDAFWRYHHGAVRSSGLHGFEQRIL